MFQTLKLERENVLCCETGEGVPARLVSLEALRRPTTNVRYVPWSRGEAWTCQWTYFDIEVLGFFENVFETTLP